VQKLFKLVWNDNPDAYKPIVNGNNNEGSESNSSNDDKPQIVKELEELTGGTAEYDGLEYWSIEKPNGNHIQLSYDMDTSCYYDVNLVLYRSIAPYELDLVKKIMLHCGGTEGAFDQVHDVVYNGLYVGKGVPWFTTNDGIFKVAAISNGVSIRRLR